MSVFGPHTASRAFLALTAGAFLAATAVDAGAVTRIRADKNACATIQAVIDRDGSAVVQWPSKRVANYLLYDRYVSPRRMCRISEELVAHTVPARDNPRCVVYLCEEVEPIFDFFKH